MKKYFLKKIFAGNKFMIYFYGCFYLKINSDYGDSYNNVQ
jgi:hypothetical protein